MPRLSSKVCVTHAKQTVEIKLKSGEKQEFSNVIKNLCPSFSPSFTFYPFPLLCTGDLQTLYNAAGNFSNVDKVYFGRETFKISDGGIVSIDHGIKGSNDFIASEGLSVRTRNLDKEEIFKIYNPSSVNDDASLPPLIILLHGLAGGSSESYIRSAVNSFEKSGLQCVVINSRGCGRTKIATPQLFNAEWTKDLKEYIEYVRKYFPNRKIFAVGFSLGASVLANYLGITKNKSLLDAAAVVANPWDLYVSSIMINNSFVGSRLYSPVLSQFLVKLLKRHELDLRGKIVDSANIDAALHAKKLSDFDNALTAPIFGYRTAGEYYREASSIRKVFDIATPTLILHSLDDPISSGDSLPTDEVKQNPYLVLATTDIGGHLGWFDWSRNRWSSEALAEFFTAMSA